MDQSLHPEAQPCLEKRNLPYVPLKRSIGNFIENVHAFLGSQRHALGRIYNMDPAATQFDMPPRYAATNLGVRQNIIRTTKGKKMAVLLFVRADGVKYPPLIVY